MAKGEDRGGIGRWDGRTQRTYRHELARPSFYKAGFFLARRVPSRILYATADLLADATRLADADPARYLRANLRSAFPRVPDREIEDLLKRTFRNFARHLVDYGRFHSLTDRELDRVLPSIDGLHPLEDCLRPGLTTRFVVKWYPNLWG
ncbi:MAG: hypothetical protein OHK0028_13760 [Deltaproteobacteria bacterium]